MVQRIVLYSSPTHYLPSDPTHQAVIMQQSAWSASLKNPGWDLFQSDTFEVQIIITISHHNSMIRCVSSPKMDRKIVGVYMAEPPPG